MSTSTATRRRDDVEDLLTNVPAAERDLLVPLLTHGAALVEQITGSSCSKSLLHRWAAHGLSGVELRVADVGRTRHVTVRWLATFWLDAAAARRAPKVKAAKRRRLRRRKKNRPAPARMLEPGTMTTSRTTNPGDRDG